MNNLLLIESTNRPLAEIDYESLKSSIIDPTTNKPYKGIILEGVFADLSNKEANNNNRFYSEEDYIKILIEFRKRVHSPNGVFGELEHPRTMKLNGKVAMYESSSSSVDMQISRKNHYAIDQKEISHRILDVWYDYHNKLVKGYILLLDTPNGKICQEKVKSGACLAISARAAGDEITNKDGTFKGVVKLITTYDIVSHPGFSTAILHFKELNESYNFNQEEHNIGYSYILDESTLNDKNYEEYLNSNSDKTFYQWLGESQQSAQQKSQQNSQQNSQQSAQQNTQQSAQQSDQQNYQQNSQQNTQQNTQQNSKQKSQQEQQKSKQEELQKIKAANKPESEKEAEETLENPQLPNEDELELEVRQSSKQELSENENNIYFNKLNKNQNKVLKSVLSKPFRYIEEPLFDNSAGFLKDNIV